MERTPPPHLEGFIGERGGFAHPDDQLNPLHIFQTPLHVYHFRSEFPPDIFVDKEGKNLNSKSSLRAMVLEGMEMVPTFLHISFTSCATTM